MASSSRHNCSKMRQNGREQCSYHQMTMTDESVRTSSLQGLGCCQDLFRYYEQKLEKYEIDYAVLDARLQEYKSAYQDYYHLQIQLTQRDDEILCLQQALSNLQVAFIDEQAKVNKYEVEVKTLRDQKLNLKNQSNYSMSSSTRRCEQEEEQELHSCCDYDHCCELMKQIQLLKEQIEVNLKINEEQKNTFIRDRQIRMEESKAARKRDAHQIRSLTIKLKNTQELLEHNTDEYFKIRRHCLARDKHKLVQTEMKYYTDGYCPDGHYSAGGGKYSGGHCTDGYYTGECAKSSSDAPAPLTEHRRVHKVPTVLKQTKPKPSCRTFTRNVSTEVQRPREDVQNELDRWKKKFEALETRRQLEINGFQSDIKTLRNQLNSIEKQLFKLYDNRNTEKNGTVLRVIHQTETRSKKISDNVRDIKRRIYTMENELRCI